MLWKIWYTDGSTYSNEDGPAENAPFKGVQIIVQDDPDVGFTRTFGHSYYYFRFDLNMWGGADDSPGLFLYWMRPGFQKVLMGEIASNEDFQAIFNAASSDPAFRVKSAYRQKERRYID